MFVTSSTKHASEARSRLLDDERGAVEEDEDHCQLNSFMKRAIKKRKKFGVELQENDWRELFRRNHHPIPID